jgi:two-component system sensor histidine kinase KdpD
MLLAAQEKRAEDVDVVIGVVKTHGRADTAALLEGLEVLPPRAIEYRGTQIREFDLDAALARHPAIIIVDELAHANAEGSRHPKRWNDVEELLDAGVDVYTALNVQHGKLNDVVSGSPGSASETDADTVFGRADEVELIDLPPDELIRRLHEERGHCPAGAAAVENFSRKATSSRCGSSRCAARQSASEADARLPRGRESATCGRRGPDPGVHRPRQAGRHLIRGTRRAAALHAGGSSHIETPQLRACRRRAVMTIASAGPSRGRSSVRRK